MCQLEPSLCVLFGELADAPCWFQNTECNTPHYVEWSVCVILYWHPCVHNHHVLHCRKRVEWMSANRVKGLHSIGGTHWPGVSLSLHSVGGTHWPGASLRNGVRDVPPTVPIAKRSACLLVALGHPFVKCSSHLKFIEKGRCQSSAWSMRIGNFYNSDVAEFDVELSLYQ